MTTPTMAFARATGPNEAEPGRVLTNIHVKGIRVAQGEPAG
jgi:hypothetical protein